MKDKYWLLVLDIQHCSQHLEKQYILLEQIQETPYTFTAPDIEAALDFCEIVLGISANDIV